MFSRSMIVVKKKKHPRLSRFQKENHASACREKHAVVVECSSFVVKGTP